MGLTWEIITSQESKLLLAATTREDVSHAADVLQSGLCYVINWIVGPINIELKFEDKFLVGMRFKINGSYYRTGT